MQTQRELNGNLTGPAQIKGETDWGEVKGKEQTGSVTALQNKKKALHPMAAQDVSR